MWYPWIYDFFNFIFLLTINYNWWRWFMYSPWNGKNMVRLQQWNMKHGLNFHGIRKFELECHCVDLFHDGEHVKFLVVHFSWQPNCLNVLLLKPTLISNLKIWLVFTMFVNIFLLSPLSFFKVGYKLCSNVYWPCNSILSCMIHNIVYTLDVKPRM